MSAPEASPPLSPKARRALVVELIQAGYGSSQQALVEALEARGVAATQATLSRDLRSLGAVKGPDGYRITTAVADPLAHAMRQWLLSATQAQNLVVLKTPPGGASPLAVVLDAESPDGVVGTIAGDDTILLIALTDRDAKRLAETMANASAGAAA